VAPLLSLGIITHNDDKSKGKILEIGCF